MEHLNYCRHMVKQLAAISSIPSASEEIRSRATHLIDLANAAQKFMLPPGGVLLEDNELKALDSAELMRLPHQFLALEYKFRESSGKIITFAREHRDSESIAVTPVFFAEENGCWSEFPTFFIPASPMLAIENRSGGRAHLNFAYPASANKQVCIDSASVVLAFLNALQCSNVHIAKSEQKKIGKKIKTALAFDTYHILTIDAPGRHQSEGEGAGHFGSHRAPREHLRRGHIRRLAGNRRVWVNATVVAAGKSAGRVSKDYAVRASQPAAKAAT